MTKLHWNTGYFFHILNINGFGHTSFPLTATPSIFHIRIQPQLALPLIFRLFPSILCLPSLCYRWQCVCSMCPQVSLTLAAGCWIYSDVCTVLRDIPCDLLGRGSDPEHPRLGTVSQIQDKHLTATRPDIKFKESITEALIFVEQIERAWLVTDRCSCSELWMKGFQSVGSQNWNPQRTVFEHFEISLLFSK